MPANQRGIKRERQVRKLLDDQGWWTCRAAGSMGDADIIAIRRRRDNFGPNSDVMLIEVKSTAAGPFSGFKPADRRELIAAADKCGATPWLVWWPSRGEPNWIPVCDWPPLRND